MSYLLGVLGERSVQNRLPPIDHHRHPRDEVRIRARQEGDGAADVFLRVPEMRERDRLDHDLREVGIVRAPLLHARSQRERTDRVDVDLVLAPLVGGDLREGADAFLRDGVRGPACVADEAGCGGP